MKVALLQKPFKFVVEDQEKPQVGPDEVLVKVAACSICGTDINAFIGNNPRSWNVVYPFKMGHELAGVIEEVGEAVPDVPGLQKGDRVVPDGRIVCGRCYYCRKGLYNLCMNQSYISGGFAEYSVYPYKNLVKIPDGISFREATLTEPLACVINGNMKLKDIPLGGVGVVIGAGPIGLLHAQLLKNRGLYVVAVDLLQHRLDVARELGVPVTINAQKQDVVREVRKLTGGRGADVVISAAGGDVSVLDQALQMAAKRGQILYFAATTKKRVELDLDLVHYHELQLVGSHDSTIAHYEAALALMKNGSVQVKPLITHSYPLERIQQAFEVAQKRAGIKVIVTNQEV